MVDSVSATRLEAAKVATSVSFVLNGWAFATWAGRIPSIRESLGLSPGQLGLLLLIGTTGSLFGLPIAGRVADRWGTAGAVRVSSSIGLPAIALAAVAAGELHSVPLTAACFFVFCFGIGLWDVCMNLEGAQVEHQLGRTIMPRYHAAFSLGTVLAAGVAAGATALGVRLSVHIGVTVLILYVVGLVAVRSFLPPEAEAGATESVVPADDRPAATATGAGTTDIAATAAARPRSAWTEPRTLLIGLVTLVAAFTEGSANDWLSVAFIDGFGLPQWAGVLGFATFLTFMTAGRLVGPVLLDRYGRVPVLRVLFVVAGFGSLLVVFGSAATAYVGAAVWGFGVALGFPVGMSAAADDPTRANARVSVVSTIAYCAFLVGPPALGFLGDHVGVLRALSVVSGLLVLAIIATPAMAPPPPRAGGGGGPLAEPAS